MIGASSRIQLTYTILEVPIPQPTGHVIDITPHEQPESPLVAPKGYRGKGKVTDDVESPKKLAKASSKLTWTKKKKMKKAVKEAKILAMRKLDLINVIHEEASKAGIDPKILESAKALFAPSPEQTSSQLPGRKRKILELEPEIRIPRLECNRSLPEGVSFVNIMVIEEPEYGMFFIDVFGDEAFQRMETSIKLAH
ncbi:hypothetical protein Tco_1338533 [Tanacetum coccineum]